MKTHTVPKWARIIGYIAAIVFTGVFLVILNNLQTWGVRFVTDRYSEVLWAINLSLGASIVAYMVFIAYDPSWFRHLTQAVLNVFSAVAVYTLYQVFPFDFGAEMWNQVARLLLGIGLVLWPLFFLVELVQGIRDLVRLATNPDLATVERR
jgi:hypothetical protein